MIQDVIPNFGTEVRKTRMILTHYVFVLNYSHTFVFYCTNIWREKFPLEIFFWSCENIMLSLFLDILCVKNYSHYFFYICWCVIIGLLMITSSLNLLLIMYLLSDEEGYGEPSQGTKLSQGQTTLWWHGIWNC